MHFSKVSALFFTSLVAAGTLLQRGDSSFGGHPYQVSENVYSNVPQQEHRYKIADNVWSNVPPVNATSSPSMVTVAKRDTTRPTLDELKANVTLAMEWMSALPAPQPDSGDEGTAIAARWAVFTIPVAQCIISMAACYGLLREDDRSLVLKLNYCLTWSQTAGYCKSRTQTSYRSLFGDDFAPDDAVFQAQEQIFIDYDGNQ
ncbi:hypothetical protein F5B22DRAFT_592380 [Xylaria bambusicola]|uniref:uncharacterized protein n=1 Tax=Xylaria bambusicola TaxID=326684 RepID=UPI002008D0F9|nr:uncharacterized protein F5B22DRAFT_592380 [Xylaria bambusicola]KAI0523875.1 hypothetical protein F5B22DRAFT_592380 [Xylaria bambusicola]